MTKRKARRRFKEREVIETLAWQGIVVPCFRCKEPLCRVKSDVAGLIANASPDDQAQLASIKKIVVETYRNEQEWVVRPLDYEHEVIWPMGKAIEREHLHERELDGADDPFNCRYSHKCCHDIITNGTKATTAGSSKQRIAKVKRIRGETKRKLKRKWPTCKLRSRSGFQRRKD